MSSEEATLRDVLEGRAGNRARTLRVAREGLPHLNAEGTNGVDNLQALNKRRRDVVQYRACVALAWTREQILEETGWPLQRLMATEQVVREEDRRIWGQVDPVAIFAEYREQQLLCAKELEDIAASFKDSKQFSALVGAVKAKSDLLDKIIKVGQELGLVKRAAREINVHGAVDVRTLSVSELRIHLEKEVSGLRKLLEPPPAVNGAAGVVLRRVLTGRSQEVRDNIAPEAPQPAQEPAEKAPGSSGPRVKRLAPPEP